jgi:perosamine synthetase
MNENYPVSTPSLLGNEKKYLLDCIESGWISSEGPYVERFETFFADRVKRKHGIAVSSGSAALDIAVTALKIGKGDEVIMPTFTIISCASSIVRSGATPVLVDCDPITFNMDVNSIERLINPATKAILIVHIYGITSDLDPILALAKKYNLKVIEDAAEMHGQQYKGVPCGSFGDISITSFYANKLITSGEGGMVLCNDDSLADRAKKLRNLFFDNGKRFIHEDLGWNYRMTNLQAAVGLAQLERIDELLLKKREVGSFYLEELRDVPGLQLPIAGNSFCENVFWIFPLLLKSSLKFNASDVSKVLQEKGVGTRPFFWPMHKQPVFMRMGLFIDDAHPVSEYIAEYGFYIPCSPSLEKSDIAEISKRLKSALIELGKDSFL